MPKEICLIGCKKITILTQEGVLCSEIVLKLDGGSGVAIDNSLANWTKIKNAMETLGVEVEVQHTKWSGEVEVKPWKETASYSHRFGQKEVAHV